MSPIRSDPISAAHGTPTFGKAKGDLEDFVVPLFEQLVGQIYLFASEVVVLRRRVNDYTEALLSKAWEKEASFGASSIKQAPRINLLLAWRKTKMRLWEHLSTLVLGEDDEEEEDEEEEEDDDGANEVAILQALVIAPNQKRMGRSKRDVSGESLVASSAEFMDDDKADEILRQLQADAPLKKLSPVYD